MIYELLERLLFGKAPYLGCLANDEIDEEIKWRKRKKKGEL
jgi:hypothetical protein